MGLEIGTLRARWDVERPEGAAYEFAQTLGERASYRCLMAGEGRCWAEFTQREMLRLLDEFTRERGLSPSERLAAREWVASLPWTGWRDALAPFPPSDPAENDERQNGGSVELYFEW